MTVNYWNTDETGSYRPSDDKEWFEPNWYELEEHKEETAEGIMKCEQCKTVKPATSTTRSLRERQWEQTGGCSGKFTPWGEWVLSEENIVCNDCFVECPF